MSGHVTSSSSVRLRPRRMIPIVRADAQLSPELSGMHHSRLCALLIDCNTTDLEAAAGFWADALGRPVDPDHPGSRGNYLMLQTPPDEPIVQVQRVSHESRVHLDIETDDIPAEVARLEKLGAKVVDRL